MISFRNNFLLLPVLMIAIFFGAINVSAHPGKTDGNGGHTNSNTGEYHYHHGYEAHFHIDGQCPFEFDDKTGQSSGNPSPNGSGGPSSNWETTSKDIKAKQETSKADASNITQSNKRSSSKEKKSDVDTGSIIVAALSSSALIYVFFVVPIRKSREYESRSQNSSYYSTNRCNFNEAPPNISQQDKLKPPGIHNPIVIESRVWPHVAHDNHGNCWQLKYQYERKLCLYGSSASRVAGMENRIITFRKEPENTYDRRAIAVYRRDERIGYIYKGEMQNMMNKWLDQKHILIGFVKSVHLSSNNVTISIAFYEPQTLTTTKEMTHG